MCNSGQDSKCLFSTPACQFKGKLGMATSQRVNLCFQSAEIFQLQDFHSRTCLFTFRIVMKTAVLQLEGLQISTKSSFFCHACPRPLDINCHNSWRIRHIGWPGQSKEGKWNSEVSCCHSSLPVTWSSYSSQGLSDLIPRYAHLYWFLSLRWAIILVY